MKICPQCRRSFTEEDTYCPSDGSELIRETEAASTNSVEAATVVSRRVGMVANAGSGAQMMPGWIFPVLGLLIGVIVILGFLVFYNFDSGNEERGKEAETEQTGELNSNSVEKRVATEDPAPTTESTPKPKPKRSTSNGTTRIKFAKGAVSSTLRRTIGERENQFFVLKASAGQYLEAAVVSTGDCVQFNGESAVIGFETLKGDNHFSVFNRCADTSYTMSVTVR